MASTAESRATAQRPSPVRLDSRPTSDSVDGMASEDIEEMKQYVGFSTDDEMELARLQAVAEQQLPQLLKDFYATILRHPDAAAAFKDPDTAIPRQHDFLTGWVRSLLQGPYDQQYAERRAAIGRAHVRHKLPQRYMLTAMNVVRRWFHGLCFQVHGGGGEALHRAMDASSRLLDLELALMLGTYRDDLLFRMQRQERLATIGEIAAGIHHELKNPLAAISVSAFALRERRAVSADPKSRELLQKIEDNTGRASEIVTELLSFARLRNPERARVTAEALLEQALARVRIPPRCRVIRDYEPARPQVHADPAQICQILVNLLTNAVDACPDGGTLRLGTRIAAAGVEIVVEDDGVGIPEADLHRVFEPLFTTKTEGVGLGLALSRHLGQANGGTVELRAGPKRGTVAVLTLPSPAGA